MAPTVPAATDSRPGRGGGYAGPQRPVGLLDFLEDALHLFQLVPELVDAHADVGQPEIGAPPR
jgi:hypothetical protein